MTVRRRPTRTCRCFPPLSEPLTPAHIQLPSPTTQTSCLASPLRVKSEALEGDPGRPPRALSGGRGCGGSAPEPPEPRAGADRGGAEKGGGTWDAAGAGRVGRNQQRTPGREAESADKTQRSYHPAPVTSPVPTCSMSATAQSLPAPAALRLGSPGSASERNRISQLRYFRRWARPLLRMELCVECSPAPSLQSPPPSPWAPAGGPEVGAAGEGLTNGGENGKEAQEHHRCWATEAWHCGGKRGTSRGEAFGVGVRSLWRNPMTLESSFPSLPRSAIPSRI